MDTQHVRGLQHRVNMQYGHGYAGWTWTCNIYGYGMGLQHGDGHTA
jgi:hypothetical protein